MTGDLSTCEPDVATWLVEQITEDDLLAAPAAALPPRFQRPMHKPSRRGESYVGTAPAYSTFIRAWTPARVLAESDAKRRIIELHADAGPSQGYTEGGYGVLQHACGTCGAHGEYGVSWPCPTLRVMLLPFADREGFREEWRL